MHNRSWMALQAVIHNINFSVRPECSTKLQRSRMYRRVFFVISLFIFCRSHAEPITIASQKIDELTQKIAISFALNKKDCLYKDFIQFSVDNPHTQLSEWRATKAATAYYDPLFKTTKNIFTNRVTFLITATTPIAHHEPTYLYFSYYQRSTKKIQQTKYCIAGHNNKPTLLTPNSLNTSLAVDHGSTKIAACHAAPIDMYRSLIYSQARHYLTYLNFTDSIHICLIILLFLLCIIPPYFFSKKLHPSVQLYE